MGQPSFPQDIKYELERLRADVNELYRRRPRRPPNLGHLQDVNGWGAAEGHALIYDQSKGRWVPKPPSSSIGAKGTRSTNQSIATYPAQVPITYPSADTAHNTAGIFTAGGSEFTAIKAGRWTFSTSITFVGNPTGGQREMWHEHNHLYDTGLDDDNPPPPASAPVVLSIHSTLYMDVGDTFRAIAQQDSGGNLDIYRALMTATFLGAVV